MSARATFAFLAVLRAALLVGMAFLYLVRLIKNSLRRTEYLPDRSRECQCCGELNAGRFSALVVQYDAAGNVDKTFGTGGG